MASAATVTAVLKLRAGGLSFIAIGDRLGLTKGQVAGIVFRATSDKYPARMTAAERLGRHLDRAANLCGRDTVAAVCRQFLEPERAA